MLNILLKKLVDNFFYFKNLFNMGSITLLKTTKNNT